MSANSNLTTIQLAWINFVKSVQLLLVPQNDDRPLDQYLVFRNAVLDLVQSEQFLSDLQSAWTPVPPPENPRNPQILNALLLELQAFPLATEVAQKTEKQEEAKGWWRRLLGRAGTATGSVKDILDNLPPYAKNAITLFKELIDMFKKD